MRFLPTYDDEHDVIVEIYKVFHKLSDAFIWQQHYDSSKFIFQIRFYVNKLIKEHSNVKDYIMIIKDGPNDHDRKFEDAAAAVKIYIAMQKGEHSIKFNSQKIDACKNV